MRTTDIVIVGAGLAGSSAAAMLARSGIDFVMVDLRSSYPPDFRCEKLDALQIQLLRKAGLDDIVLPSATSIEQLWVVRLGRFVHKRANDELGIYYDSLVNELRTAIPPTRLTLARVASVTTSSDRQIVTLSDGSSISARLVVLATGANSALPKSLGIDRQVVSRHHSISIGFDLKPVGKEKFSFPALTYHAERPRDPIAYLTLFPIGSGMRANLFVYYDIHDPWLRRLREAPQATILSALPGLRPMLGEFEVTSAVRVRSTDLYGTSGHRQAGVVLVGDAFASSCPATGTGATKVLTDVERLCHLHIPRWLATEGMGQEKIAAFYDDPEKRACDARSMAVARSLRSFSRDRSLRWRVRRVIRMVGGFGRGMLFHERAR